MALATADNIVNTNNVLFHTNYYRSLTEKETKSHTSN